MRRKQQPAADSARHGSARRSRILAAVLPVAAALIAYAGALDHPFVYDDYDTVVANPSLSAPINPKFVLIHSPFRPVVNVSYAIDRLLWGYRPFGFHLTNLLLHATVVALLYALIVRVLRDSRLRSTAASPPYDRREELYAWIACFAATLFAVHPLMTEAVGYVSGRSELLCAVFFLSAVLCGRMAMAGANRAADPALAVGGHGPRSPWPAAAGALVFAVLAFLSKEVAVALPVILLAYDWLVLPGPTAPRKRRLWLFFVPAGLLAAVVASLRVAALLERGDNAFAAPFLNLLTQLVVIWRYLGLLFVPVGQSIMHGVRYVTTPLDPLALIALAAFGLLGWMAYRLRRTVPGAAFGLVWFFGVIAPSSSVVSLREGMAEHRVYVAGAGLFMTIAAIVAERFERAGQRREIAPIHVVAAAGIVTALFALTLARHQMWEHPVRLWSEAARRAPDMWEPHYALADALRDSGQCAAAVSEYEAVIRMRPAHRDANTNLGICLAQTGRLAEADTAFRRALEIDPGFVRGLTNLGALAITAGDFDRAREMYLEALEIDRQNVFARMQLARLYEEVFRDYHAAARMCGEARAIQPFTPGVVECVERNQKLAAAKAERR
jgi:tetratricopeptide (TPR) repeat protein